MIVSDGVSLSKLKKKLRSDGEDEAQGKEGNTVDVVKDCKAFVCHCHKWLR